MIPMRDLVSHSIGGGWGEELRADGTEQVAIIRGADFPRVAVGDTSGVPRRWESARKLPQRTLQPGDIVLEGSGGTSDRPTGRTVFISEQLLDRFEVPVIPASFCRLVRINPALADPHYVYWWLQGMYAEGRTWGYQNRSTGIANFQFQHFLDTETVRLPRLDEQRAIATTLGALDDKIESNRQIGAGAVNLSAELYSAALLRGRHLSTIGDIADFHNRRRVPLSSAERSQRAGSVPYYGATGVFGYVNEALFNEVLVLVGEDGSVVREDGGPVLQYVWGPAWINNHAHPLTGRGISNETLYMALNRADIRPIVTGAVQPKVNMRNLKSLPVELPRDLGAIEGDLSALFSLYKSKQDEVVQLAALRDALLPELLSGRIRVRVEGIEA